MKKRVLAILMTLVMVVTLMPMSAFATEYRSEATVDIKGAIEWIDCNDKEGMRPSEVIVVIKDSKSKEVASQIITAEANWEWEFNGLPKYDENGDEINYDVVGQGVENYISWSIKQLKKTGSYGLEIEEGNIAYALLTAFETSGSWDDDENRDGIRPDVNLVVGKKLENDKYYSVGWVFFYSITEEFKHEWKMPKYNKDGTLAEFFIELVDETDFGKEYYERIDLPGYTCDINGGTVILSHTPETIDLSGNISWVDNNGADGKRPDSVTVKLLANGKEVDSVGVTEKDGWNWIFESVYKYEAGKEIKYTYEIADIDEYSANIEDNQIKLTQMQELSGSIIWTDDNNRDGIRPENCKVDIIDEAAAEEQFPVIYGSVTLDDRPSWTEYIPKYTEDGNLIKCYPLTNYELYKSFKDVGYDYIIEHEENGFDVEAIYTPETITLADSIKWNDTDNNDGLRPETVTIELFANDKFVYSQQVMAADNWEWSFDDVYKNENGEPIKYTYFVNGADEYWFSMDDGTEIIGEYIPKKAELKAAVQWIDNNGADGKRPDSVKLKLLANGKEVDSVNLTEDNNWQWNFEGFNVYEKGQEIKYTYEVDDVDGYRTSVKNNKISLTQIQQITSKVVWDDADDQDRKRPISVKLGMQSGAITENTILQAVNWNYVWTKDVYDKDGEKVNYNLKINKDSEKALKEAGYTIKINGYDVTFSRTPEVTELQGQIKWDDADDQDGKRPDQVIVQLFADGEEKDTVTVTEKDSWNWSFTGLDKYCAGEEISYTIGQTEIEKYKTEIKGNEIVNIHETEKINVPISAVWYDDSDETRPGSVAVTLLADGKTTECTLQMNAENDWTVIFEWLDKYKKGKEIEYTYAIGAADGYETVITETGATFLQIKDNIAAVIWDDADDQDGKRPGSLELILKSGDTEEVIELTADGWEYAWSEASYDTKGNLLEYQVSISETDEKALKATGYTVEIDDLNLTLTRVPETVDMQGQIKWDDVDNQDGKRPEQTIVELLADGEKVDETAVTAKDGWKWSFDGLDKYCAGKEINYTVDQASIENYNTEIQGNMITNSHETEKIDIPVAVTWHDGDDEGGVRPEAVTAILLKDGKAAGQTLEINEDNEWSGEFANLDKYAAGSEVEYTYEIADVEGYQKVVTDEAVTFLQIKEYEVAITWDDADDQDGKRPETLEMILKSADSEEALEFTADEWGYSWSETAYDMKGNLVDNELCLSEASSEALKAAGYIVVIDGLDVDLTRETETVNIQGQIIWDDANNKDDIRPEKVVVEVLADGKLAGTATTTVQDNWQWSFAELDKYSEGAEIDYSVTASEVEGYTVVIENGNITYSHEPKQDELPPAVEETEPSDPSASTEQSEPTESTKQTDSTESTDAPVKTTAESDNAVQSGDDFNMELYTVVAAMAIAVAVLACRRKKESK